ncbi:MAG: MFS transporter [Bacillota bacterium]
MTSWQGHFVFLLIASAGTTPVLYAVLAEFYADRIRDRAVGIISGTGSLLGVTIAPAILGFLIEHYEPPVTFLAAAGIVLAGLVATFLVGRLRRADTAGSSDYAVYK